MSRTVTDNAFFDCSSIFLFSERYKLVAILFLFLGLLLSVFFASLIGIWLKTEFQLMSLFVYMFICLGVPPLLLIFWAGADTYSTRWIESYDGLFSSPSGVSYNYDFLGDSEGRLFNALPVFKGV